MNKSGNMRNSIIGTGTQSERGIRMATKAGLPMGIEDFQEMRTAGYYYVDKTGMIRDFLENMGKVTLFTRPRRFGKTLNMSMICLIEKSSESANGSGNKIFIRN